MDFTLIREYINSLLDRTQPYVTRQEFYTHLISFLNELAAESKLLWQEGGQELGDELVGVGNPGGVHLALGHTVPLTRG